MLRPLLVVFFMAVSTMAHAIAPIPPIMPPRLIVPRAQTPVRLQSLHINAEISGGLAQTTVEMVFYNPNAVQLEGELQFPLLPGQRVTAFALDIDGALRPAVPVEKAKGRMIFEEVERRRIDPALLEVTQGNNFKLRVYPIPPRGTRTVQLKYAEPLARNEDQRLYRLPLAYGDAIAEFDLELNVHGATVPPQPRGALGSMQFERQQDGYRAHVSKSAYRADGTLELALATSTQPQTFVQEFDGDTYFLSEIAVGSDSAPQVRVPPAVLGLLWDSSGSGAQRQTDAELAVLDHYFKAVPNVEVRLIRLRDRAEASQRFRIVNGNWSALRTALTATAYDGASALGAWKPEADINEYLLVSDGLSNYGDAPFPTLTKAQRLYALNSALVSDSGRLAALAERNGGRLVQLQANQPEQAAQALLADTLRLSDINANGAKDISVESHEPQDGVLRVAGRLTQPSAELTLTLTQQGKSRTVTLPVNAGAPYHPLAAGMWAGYRLQALEADYELKRGEIRRLGQRFGIPTRETSLLVLDRLEDYVRYDIEPPAAYKEAYAQLKQNRLDSQRRVTVQHTDQIVREFEQKVAWWEKSYPKSGLPKQIDFKATDEVSADAAPESIRAARSAYAPPAPAPMPLAAPALSYGRMDAQRAETAARPKAAPVGEASTASIQLKKWSPNEPYRARMKSAKAADLYAIYLDEKPNYTNSSAFFLDSADMLLEQGQRDLALRVLSNLAEMNLENRQVLRILGYRLLQAGEPALAIPVFQQVLRLAEEEPQSYRDLGLAYAAAGQVQPAVDQLAEVLNRPWDGRFAEIELVTLAELNAIIAKATVKPDTSRIDRRLLRNLPLALRAVLTWDADNTDIDLWVTDPNGEKCYYANRYTYQGGRMSRDFTGGYGPEEFSLRVAKPGKYRVEVNSFGHRQQIVAGATTVQLRLSTGFGTPKQRDQMVTLRLRDTGSTVLVGEFEVN
ncbi:MAG: VIT domain-containing protein [Pseudomonadota bacterium]